MHLRNRAASSDLKGSLGSILALWQMNCLRVLIAVMKHDDQKASQGEKGLQLALLYHSSSSKEVRAGTQAGQEPESRS